MGRPNDKKPGSDQTSIDDKPVVHEGKIVKEKEKPLSKKEAKGGKKKTLETLKQESNKSIPPKLTNAQLIEKSGKLLTKYIDDKVIGNYEDLPIAAKMSCLTASLGRYVKHRPIGKLKVPYIPHQVSRRAANFLFNFKISNEIMDSELKEIKTTNSGGTIKSIYECMVDVKFTYEMEGKEYCRTVTGTGKAYENPAITSFDVKKMAISNAWNLFFQSFGFYPDEIEKYEEKKEDTQEEEPSNEPQNDNEDVDRPGY